MSKAKQQNDSTDYAHITEKSQTVLIRKENGKYQITALNPLTGEVSFETKTSWLKINDFGIAAPKIELSEHKKRIGITENGNIELDV